MSRAVAARSSPRCAVHMLQDQKRPPSLPVKAELLGPQQGGIASVGAAGRGESRTIVRELLPERLPPPLLPQGRPLGFMKLMVTSHRIPISLVEVYLNSKWIKFSRSGDNYWQPSTPGFVYRAPVRDVDAHMCHLPGRCALVSRMTAVHTLGLAGWRTVCAMLS